jgi:hypothetical protein
MSDNRKKAIRILEAIAEAMGDESMFDCKCGDNLWYDLEDIITNILDEKKKKK